ncbi:MAG: hypothetical protein JXA30_00865 [Deltaproteobacteria bacterium]|nr:hypothetical protein [Deltaproteobacteria bacterium]
MFPRDLSLCITCLLLLSITPGCSENSGGTESVPQSGSGGPIPQAGTGETTTEVDSGSLPPAGSGALPPAGSGGSAGMVVGGGNEVVGGSSGGSVTGGSGGTTAEGCPVQTVTNGVHIIVDISWPETLGTLGGEGQLHIWVKSTLTPGEIQADGSYTVTGESLACGTLLPEIYKSDLIGGGQMFIDVPWEAFDSPAMTTTATSGTISGAKIGAAMNMNPAVTQVGVELADPLNDPWPATGNEMLQLVVDAEGDGKPGITGVPRAEAPFSLPPTDIVGALAGTGLADRLYLVTRSVVKLTGTRDSCTTASGTAEVTAFDNHVIGCRIRDTGADCDVNQANFVDLNRTVYELHEGSYQQVTVAETATCAEVRAALPAE